MRGIAMPSRHIIHNRSKPLSRPRVLVLDIDHTLLHSTTSPKVNGYIPSFRTYKTKLRPGVKTFLERIRPLFTDIIVWSAGERRYVDWMTKIIFDGVSYQPKLVMAREDCASSQSIEDDGSIGCTYYKPIYRVLMRPEFANSGLTMSDVVILDDSGYTFIVNSANGILAERFSGLDNDQYLEMLAIALEQAFSTATPTEPLTSIIYRA